jgi:hypothetical protein
MTNENNDPLATGIDTRYDGHKFRSRTEARWAVFFNATDIDWRYEPEGYDLPDGSAYLPDFYFPNMTIRTTEGSGMWCEIKGENISYEDDWTDEPFDTLIKLVEKTETPAALLSGKIRNEDHHEVNYFSPDSPDIDLTAGTDWPMVFMMCEDCDRIKYEFREGNYMSCEVCDGHCHPKHHKLQRAIKKATEARFEHGESPDV